MEKKCYIYECDRYPAAKRPRETAAPLNSTA
jgi:hypothetical protein